MRRRFLLVALAAVAAIATAGAASAAKPRAVEKKNTFTRVFSGLEDCLAYGYDFTFSAEFTVTRTVREFYNAQGDLVREVRHIRFVGSETNDVTGKSLPVNGVRVITLNFVRGTFTETGVLRHVTVPGSGIVLHESGRIVTGLEDESVIFRAGPHQLFEGELAAYCAELATA